MCSSDLWQDQSGADKFTTEVVLQNFNGTLVLLDRAEGGGGGGGQRGGGGGYNQDDGGYGGGSGAARGGGATRPGAFDSDLDDDVPF